MISLPPLRKMIKLLREGKAVFYFIGFFSLWLELRNWLSAKRKKVACEDKAEHTEEQL